MPDSPGAKPPFFAHPVQIKSLQPLLRSMFHAMPCRFCEKSQPLLPMPKQWTACIAQTGLHTLAEAVQ